MENYQAMKTNKVIFFLLALAVDYACPMWGSPDDDGEKDKTVNTGNILKPITPIDTAGISIIKDPTIHIGSEPVNNLSNYDVGSPKGAFSVNGSGSAIYRLSMKKVGIILLIHKNFFPLPYGRKLSISFSRISAP